MLVYPYLGVTLADQVEGFREMRELFRTAIIPTLEQLPIWVRWQAAAAAAAAARRPLPGCMQGLALALLCLHRQAGGAQGYMTRICCLLCPAHFLPCRSTCAPPDATPRRRRASRCWHWGRGSARRPSSAAFSKRQPSAAWRPPAAASHSRRPPRWGWASSASCLGRSTRPRPPTFISPQRQGWRLVSVLVDLSVWTTSCFGGGSTAACCLRSRACSCTAVQGRRARPARAGAEFLIHGLPAAATTHSLYDFLALLYIIREWGGSSGKGGSSQGVR